MWMLIVVTNKQKIGHGCICLQVEVLKETGQMSDNCNCSAAPSYYSTLRFTSLSNVS